MANSADIRTVEALQLGGTPEALYIIRPLPAGDYELTGPTLPYPLRFRDDAAPLNHAHFAGRGQTGKAIVLSRSGAVLFCANGWPGLWRAQAVRCRVETSTSRRIARCNV